VPANQLLVRNVTVIGFWYGGYLTQAPSAVSASLQELLAWWAEGSLRPQVGQVLPFDALPEGLAMLRDRKAPGKLVIQVDN